jgi:hypothetical protein
MNCVTAASRSPDVIRASISAMNGSGNGSIPSGGSYSVNVRRFGVRSAASSAQMAP